MIKDTRSNYISVSTELVTDKLVSAGNINGIPSYFCYKTPSVKKIYSFKYFLLPSEIDKYTKEKFNNIFVGYNKSDFILDTQLKGNITDLKVNEFVYIDDKLYYGCDITAISYPEFEELDLDHEEIVYENQIKILGFYLDGTSYLDNIKSTGSFKKTKKMVDQIQFYKLSVSPKEDFGNLGKKSFTLSVSPIEYKYIISPTGEKLFINVEIIEINA